MNEKICSIKIETETKNLDETIAKVKALNELLKEANSLILELASKKVDIIV